MPKSLSKTWPMLCALALCSCATTGAALQCPEPPRLPPPPAELMTPPNFEQRIRALLFELEPRPTPSSGSAKQP